MRKTAAPAGYDADFALWAESQAAALRDGRFEDLDVPNLAEEVEALARRDRRELRSRLTELALHLLKLQYQPGRASGSWCSTILEQATRIKELLDESPSLAPSMPEVSAGAYRAARRRAALETALPLATFPETPTPDFERAAARAANDEDFEI
jgi:hypothetical protein